MKFYTIIVFTLKLWFVHAQHDIGNQISTFEIYSPELKTNKVIQVYLPTNYSTSKKNYPVIYMHDGQNLFDSKTSFAGEWNVDETLDSINAQVIVVGISHGGDLRMSELSPFKNQKYGGGNASNYLKFIVETVKPRIDKSYRTKKSVKQTGIFGSSLGGLVSFYAALQYPTVFGKIGCFSPSFWFNRKEIFELIELKKRFSSKIYFLCGDQEGDDDMLLDLNEVEKQLDSNNKNSKKRIRKVIVKNGNHNEKLWREGFKKAYLWLF